MFWRVFVCSESRPVTFILGQAAVISAFTVEKLLWNIVELGKAARTRRGTSLRIISLPPIRKEDYPKAKPSKIQILFFYSRLCLKMLIPT
jgi:hypothetical protein